MTEKKAFILMPFKNPYNSYYPSIFKPALESIGYQVTRADDLFAPQPIITDICKSISDADLILCEMSERNPNVFYELGLAHAIGKPAILLSREEEDIPFDFKHIRIIIYDYKIAGWEAKLKNDIINSAQSISEETDDLWPPPLIPQSNNIVNLSEANIKSLSPIERNILKKNLVYSDLPENIVEIDSTLYEHLHSVIKRCTSSVIIRNYNETITRVAHPDDPSLVIKECAISFTFDSDHFLNSKAVIPYKFCISFADIDVWQDHNNLEDFKFEGKIGNRKLTKDDLQITSDYVGKYAVKYCLIDLPIECNKSIAIRYKFSCIIPITDRTETIYLRYPCKGFNVTFRYLDGYDYDYAWYAQWTQHDDHLPRIEEVQTMRDGIVVSSNDWLLPGEGVSLEWSEPLSGTKAQQDAAH